MGEIPVLEDGNLVLSQPGTILHYLADKHRSHADAGFFSG
jgi:glutathione S-transferase